MTTKTIKTILFASLIVAMILPFSVMEFAQAAPNVSQTGLTHTENALLSNEEKAMRLKQRGMA